MALFLEISNLTACRGRKFSPSVYPLKSQTKMTCAAFHSPSRRTISLKTCSLKRACFPLSPLRCLGKSTESLVDSVEEAEVEESLIEYILKGPLLKNANILEAEVARDVEIWQSLGVKLAEQLSFNPVKLTDTEKLRIYHYYLPVYFWCLKQLEGKTKPVVIGISAPQGCGKTTVVESLDYLFNSTGKRAASVSIDDFYLTFSEQTALARSFPENKLLELRGNAGSHDLGLGIQTLSALKSLTLSSSVKLPRYDKSANSGKGDRAKEDSWPTVQGPLDVILFEGWMLGFEPVAPETASSVDPHLVEVNDRLKAYSSWHNFVDSWVVVEVEDPSWVYNWRRQAEVQMRSMGKAGMTDEEVADFVSRYMPAYQAYLPGLYHNGPLSSSPDKVLQFRITENRSPLG